MKKIQIVDKKGKKIEVIELSSRMFETDANAGSLHQAVRAHLANRRAGTADTKTRREVAGGSAKPWRQKGTGRARAGSIRAPHFTGGGTVFGPTPRDYTVRINKKARKLAFFSAISEKLKAGHLVVLSNFKLREFKTKEAGEIIENLKIVGRVMLILSQGEKDVSKAFRNLPQVSVRLVENVATYDILLADHILISKDTLVQLQEIRG